MPLVSRLARSRRLAVRGAASARLARRVGWALAGLPLAIAYGTLLAAALAGAVLSIIGVGLPLLAAGLALARGAASVERMHASSLLGVDVAAPPPPPHGLRARLADTAGWRALGWLALRCLLAGSAAVLLLGCGLAGVAAAAVPFADGWLEWESWRSPSGPLMAWTLLLVPVVAVIAVAGLDALASVGRAAAPRLLGGGAEAEVAALTRRSAQLGERARLAAQLHDSVGHTVTANLLQAAAARRAFDRDPGFARQALASIEQSSRRALDELDRVLATLADDAPPPPRGLADLDELVTGLRAAGLPVTVTTAPLGELPGHVDHAALRVVQEATTNVLRHAGTPPTDITLARDPGALRVSVRNDPPSGDAAPRPGGGRGLAGLRDLATSLGGSLEAWPTPGGGFALTAELPLP